MKSNSKTTVLDDVLVQGLDIVICGTAAGRTSALVGRYYARPGNRFWSVLHTTGLTPRPLGPHEYRLLPQYGIGLTDLCKHTAGCDHELQHEDFDVDSFRTRIAACAPRVVAFNGKKAAQTVLGRTVVYGRQPETVSGVTVYVLPSTSAAAHAYWDETHWHAAATAARGC